MNNYMQRKISKAKENNIELVLTQNLYENKQDSIWYDGLIGYFIYKNRYQINIIASGDIKVEINNMAYKYPSWDDLYENGIKSDHDLFKKLQEGTFSWIDNNWFEFNIFDKEKEEYITDVLETDNVLDSLNDALDTNEYINFIRAYEKENQIEMEI